MIAKKTPTGKLDARVVPLASCSRDTPERVRDHLDTEGFTTVVAARERRRLQRLRTWLMEQGFWVSTASEPGTLLRLSATGAPHDVVVIVVTSTCTLLDSIELIVDPKLPQSVVALVDHGDRSLAKRCIAAGASQVLPYPCPRLLFIETVGAEAHHNRTTRAALSRMRASRAGTQVVARDPSLPRPLLDVACEAGCTPREIEILRLVSLGLTYGAIGKRLRLSRRTIEAHAGSAYRRLGVSRSQIIRRYGGNSNQASGTGHG